MAKEADSDLTNVSDELKKGIEAVAKVMGVAVIELWTIFVRQYFVRGLTMLFTALLLLGGSVVFWPYIHLFVLVPVVASIVFFYETIIYLGNPKYYALQDITQRISDISERRKDGASAAKKSDYEITYHR